MMGLSLWWGNSQAHFVSCLFVSSFFFFIFGTNFFFPSKEILHFAKSNYFLIKGTQYHVRALWSPERSTLSDCIRKQKVSEWVSEWLKINLSGNRSDAYFGWAAFMQSLLHYFPKLTQAFKIFPTLKMVGGKVLSLKQDWTIIKGKHLEMASKLPTIMIQSLPWNANLQK